MLRMRPLKPFILFFMCLANNAFSAYGEIDFSVSQSPPLNFDENTNAGTFTSYSSQLSVGEIKVFSALTLIQGLQTSRIDKSQYGFLDHAQKDIYPKNSHALELKANTQLNYQSGHYSGSVGSTYPITNNLVKQFGLDTSHSVDFYNKSTIIGVTYKYLKEFRPESYFLDFDFTVKNRPARANAHEASFFYEQLVSEKFKFRIKPFFINRPEERPDAWGGEALFAYAPVIGHVLKFKSLYAAEKKSQTLKNERGYFKLLSANVSWDYEYQYGTLLGLSYTYQREDEENPRNLTTRTLGLDSIGAFFEKKLSAYTIKLSGNYSRSNLNSNFWGSTISLRREI